MNQTQVITWIGKPLEKQKAVAAALEARGFTCLFLEPPSSCTPHAVSSWMQENIQPEQMQSLFLEGINLQWLDTLFTQVRNHKNYALRFSPVFWVYDGFEPEIIKRVVNIGVDELVNLNDSPESLALRIHIRFQQAETLRRLQKRLDEQARRSAASETALKQREEFLSVCAHDMRSPIGLIQSSLSMILDGKDASDLPPMVKELLERSQRQTGSALRLINDLLDVMSFEQGLKPQYELFHLDELLKEFYGDYRSQAEEKGVHFHYDNPVPQWKVLADKDRIQQLLQNLLGNALKFTDKGKNIYLSVTSFKGRRKSDPPYPMVIISFKDEGKGIPQVERERIFDRFSQIKDYSRAGGRGLGLTVAKQISTLHAGNLWVESEPGKGSTFHVLLPHVVSRTKNVRKESRAKIGEVVIVEPTEAKREKNFGALKKAGYQLHFVRDGVEAIAMAFHAQPDAVILRHDTHKISEREVASILHEHDMTAAARVFLGLESGESAQKADMDESHIEAIVPVPTTPQAFETPTTKEKKKTKRAA